MSFIAPQAYTKETLSKAFDWLQHQPQNVREVATSPDILVNLFLRAQRQGLNRIDADAPNSARKFIEDLNSLKKDMAQFEETPQQKAATLLPPIPLSTPAHNSSLSFPSAGTAQKTVPTPPHYESSVSQKTTINTAQSITIDRTTTESHLDETSSRLVEEIQQRFNLSSTQEVLRLMITVAHKQISKWD